MNLEDAINKNLKKSEEILAKPPRVKQRWLPWLGKASVVGAMFVAGYFTAMAVLGDRDTAIPVVETPVEHVAEPVQAYTPIGLPQMVVENPTVQEHVVENAIVQDVTKTEPAKPVLSWEEKHVQELGDALQVYKPSLSAIIYVRKDLNKVFLFEENNGSFVQVKTYLIELVKNLGILEKQRQLIKE